SPPARADVMNQDKPPPPEATTLPPAPPQETTAGWPAAAGTGWAPVELPARFGRYELRELLGKGGMGAVYLAHDPHLDRLVAPETPPAAAVDSEEQTARFLREARAVAALSHPGICPVHDVGHVNGVLYLTMAFIDGEPLSSQVRPGEPLPPDE